MSTDIPVETALILEPSIDPIKHSHIFTDNKTIQEDCASSRASSTRRNILESSALQNDVLEFQFPEQSRTESLITYTHIQFNWPNPEQISASYYLAAVTPAAFLPLSHLTPVSRGQWLRLRQPIPTMPLEDSLIVAILNIEDNLEPNQPTCISMKLSGFDHIYTYDDQITFPCGVKLVCNGLRAKFIPQDFTNPPQFHCLNNH